MNMNEKDIDHLTRKLMRGTAEQPSASLNSRIMALIIQEKKRVYKYYIKKRFTPVGIFSIFVAYMLVLVGILYLVKLSPGGTETVLGSLRAYFPIAFAANDPYQTEPVYERQAVKTALHAFSALPQGFL